MNINKLSILFSVLLGALVCSSQSFSQEFGKLFTAPEERAYLDYLREDFLARSAEAGFDIADDAVPEIPVDADGQPEDEVEFHLGGIMTRVDGERTVWLNNIPLLESELPSTTRIVTLEGVAAIQIDSPEGRFVLKPGQTVNVTTGEFWDAFEHRASTDSLEGEIGPVNPQLEPDEEEFSTESLVNLDLIRSLQFLQEVGDDE